MDTAYLRNLLKSAQTSVADRADESYHLPAAELVEIIELAIFARLLQERMWHGEDVEDILDDLDEYENAD